MEFYDDDDDQPPPKVAGWDEYQEYWHVFRLTFPTQVFWLFVYLAIALLGYSVVGYKMAKAQDIQVQAGVGLVCDTQKQVERFTQVMNGDYQAAIKQVNAEVGDDKACLIAGIYYVRGKDLAKATINGERFIIAEVLVLGVETNEGPRRLAEPVVWYSLFKSEEKEA